jgi:hypothetical protein
LPAIDHKQRAVVLGDLAAVEVAAENPTEACRHISAALDRARPDLVRGGDGPDPRRPAPTAPLQDDPCVRDLDDRLFGGTPPSARSGVERIDQCRELGQAVDPERRDARRIRVVLLIVPQGPRLSRAVAKPDPAAGRTSLSRRSPT